jgi:hypothetical protein
MKRTTFSPAVLALLERDRIATLNLVGILRNEPGTEILVDDEASPRGVLAKGPWFWYLHTEEATFLEAVFLEMERQAGFYRFSGVWRPLAEKIKERFPVAWDAPCDLYHWPPGNPPPQPQQVQSVAFRDAEIVDQHYPYRHARSLEQIQNCIRQRHSSAVYVDGAIVCWVLVHEDDSLGIMHTLEGHRRKGHGVAVTLDLVRKQLADGRTPFLQIRNDNSLSPGLARKCGFVQHGSCDWFGVMVGTPQEVIEGGIAFRRRSREGMEQAGPGSPEREVVCLFRLLHALQPDPSVDNPVVMTEDEGEWTGFTSRYFEAELLSATLGRLRKDCRLLCERRSGAITATTALLVDEHDCFELLWLTSREEDFLRNVLHRAKVLGLDAAFVHVPREEQGRFERLGFREIPSEVQPQS